jgi:chromosome segregation ATPase
MTDCDACGTTITACNDGIRETGRECCPLCLTQDTHHMLEPQNSAALVKEMHEYTRHAAATIIWRTEVGKELGRLVARCEYLEESVNSLQAANERLVDEMAGLRGRMNQKREELTAAVKQSMLAATLAEVAKTVLDLPERLAIIERALPEIERKIGLKRRAKEFQVQKALPAAKEKQP